MGNFSTDSFPNNRWVTSDTLNDLAEAIQSIDAAMRHAFGFSTSSLSAPFDIADDGSIVVQTSIAIGTSNAMIDVVDSIPASAGANEDQKLAHVDAIRTFLTVQRLPGENIDLSTSNFDNNLSSADDTTQKALDTLDDIDLNNLIHLDEVDEFTGVDQAGLKVTDHMLFEDAGDLWAKKWCTVQQLVNIVTPASHTHSDAIHSDVDGEIHTIATATPAIADVIVLEDASDGWSKKSSTLETLINDVIIPSGDHGGLLGLADDDHPQYTLHSLATAESDFLVASGVGVFVKKTLAEVGAILEADLDHGSIQGLGDDDHALYLLASDATDRSTFATNWTDLTDTNATTLHKHDHGGSDGLADDDHVQYLLRAEWLQNGFPDASEVDMDWDDGSLTLTIQPVGANFTYYYDGVLYTEAGSLTETITDTEGLWVIYIDGEGSLASVNGPSYAQVESVILNECIVAYVYWDAANNDGRLMGELHGSTMSPATHHYLHDIMGAQYSDGISIGDIDVDQNGSTNAHAQFSVSAGEIYDEDVGHDIAASTQTATKEVFYIDGSGYSRWTDAAANLPVAVDTGVIVYNNGGTLTAVSNNYYVLYHVFATNIKTDANGDYPIIMIPGEAQYASKAGARDAALTEIANLSTGDWPVDETVPIATVIYQRKNTMTNDAEASTVSTDTGEDYIDWRYSSATGTGGASASDHGLLSGLADDDHVQYVLHSLATAESDFLVASGSGVYVKKTLAETGAILEADLDHGSIQGLGDDDHSQYTLHSLAWIMAASRD